MMREEAVGTRIQVPRRRRRRPAARPQCLPPHTGLEVLPPAQHHHAARQSGDGPLAGPDLRRQRPGGGGPAWSRERLVSPLSPRPPRSPPRLRNNGEKQQKEMWAESSRGRCCVDQRAPKREFFCSRPWPGLCSGAGLLSTSPMVFPLLSNSLCPPHSDAKSLCANSP